MKRTLLLVLGFALAALLAALVWQAGRARQPTAGAGDVRFKWAFIHTDGRGVARVLDFAGTPRAATGERIRVYVAPLADTCVYLVMQDSSGAFELVFPPTPDFYARSRAPGTDGEYYVPESGAFLLDEHTGTEKFYLFGAPRRLYDLEQRLAAFVAAPGDPSAAAALSETLVATHRRNSGLARAATTGVPIAGTVVTRGGEEVSGDAQLVETKGFYTAVLRLAHD